MCLKPETAPHFTLPVEAPDTHARRPTLVRGSRDPHVDQSVLGLPALRSGPETEIDFGALSLLVDRLHRDVARVHDQTPTLILDRGGSLFITRPQQLNVAEEASWVEVELRQLVSEGGAQECLGVGGGETGVGQFRRFTLLDSVRRGDPRFSLSFLIFGLVDRNGNVMAIGKARGIEVFGLGGSVVLGAPSGRSSARTGTAEMASRTEVKPATQRRCLILAAHPDRRTGSEPRRERLNKNFLPWRS